MFDIIRERQFSKINNEKTTLELTKMHIISHESFPKFYDYQAEQKCIGITEWDKIAKDLTLSEIKMLQGEYTEW